VATFIDQVPECLRTVYAAGKPAGHPDDGDYLVVRTVRHLYRAAERYALHHARAFSAEPSRPTVAGYECVVLVASNPARLNRVNGRISR